MSAGPDPRIVWQRALLADADLPRTARLVGLVLGATLTYAGKVSVGIDQLIEQTGYRRRVLVDAMAALRRAGWVHVERRGYRGRTSSYLAEIPGLIRRVEVGVTGREYVRWTAPTSGESVRSSAPIEHDYVRPTAPTSGESVRSSAPIDPTRCAPPHHSPYVEELRTYVGDDARQTPALAAVPAPGVAEVIQALPGRLRPVSASAARRMEQLVAQRLASGWEPAQLVEATAHVGDVAVKDAPAFWASLVPVVAPARPAERWRPTWCGVCDERTRMVELPDGSPMRCGNCNPQVLGVPEPRP